MADWINLGVIAAALFSLLLVTQFVAGSTEATFAALGNAVSIAACVGLSAAASCFTEHA